jgi:multiple sugar transport system permease protein
MAVSADRQVVAGRTKSERPASFYVGATIRYTLLIVASLLAFAPFILSFLGTFKTNIELTSYPPSILPQTWDLDNWVRVWNFTLPTVEGQVLPRWLINSTWLALLNVALRLFFCSLAAFAFARLRFPGRDIIFAVVIASMAFPGEVSLIPGYVFYARLGWINTYWPLIVPDLVVPIGIFMLTQFFKSIPKDLEEAAYIDGLGPFGVYWNIVLPLSQPILITLAILQFQAVWNDFVKPLLFLRDVNLMTLTVGMNFFQNQYSNDFSAILVGAMFNAIPVLVLFFVLNKYFLGSAAYSGLAGQ